MEDKTKLDHLSHVFGSTIASQIVEAKATENPVALQSILKSPSVAAIVRDFPASASAALQSIM